MQVLKTLTKDVGPLYIIDEVLDDPLGPYFGLASSDLTTIKPNYDAMIKTGHLKVNDPSSAGIITYQVNLQLLGNYSFRFLPSHINLCITLCITRSRCSFAWSRFKEEKCNGRRYRESRHHCKENKGRCFQFQSIPWISTRPSLQ